MPSLIAHRKAPDRHLTPMACKVALELRSAASPVAIVLVVSVDNTV